MDYPRALKFLIGRFPELTPVLPGPDDPEFENIDVYHAYAEFAEQLLRRQRAERFRSSATNFIDDLVTELALQISGTIFAKSYRDSHKTRSSVAGWYLVSTSQREIPCKPFCLKCTVAK
jgi:hypothetical protein